MVHKYKFYQIEGSIKILSKKFKTKRKAQKGLTKLKKGLKIKKYGG